jgi:integrase
MGPDWSTSSAAIVAGQLVKVPDCPRGKSDQAERGRMSMGTTTTAAPRPERGRKGASSEIAQLRDEILSSHYKQSPRSTIDVVRLVVRLAMEHAGITRFSDLDDRGVNRFLRALDKHYAHVSPRTRAGYISIFKGFCRKVHDLGRIPSMPKFPALPRNEEFANVRETPRLSTEIADLLLERLEAGAGTWKGHRLYALIATMMFTGLLRNESFRVRVEDVDLETGALRVPRREQFAKSIRRPVVRMGAKLTKVLEAWLPLTGCEWVFPGEQGKGPWAFTGKEQYCAAYAIRAAGEAVGFQRLSPAVLRKFYEDYVHFDTSHIEEAIESRRAKRIAELRTLPGTCVVTLEEQGRRAFVRGKDMGILTHSRFKLVKLLHDAGPQGLSAAELNGTEKDGWRKTLLRLRKSDPAWSEAIIFPGGPYGGNYHLAWGQL